MPRFLSLGSVALVGFVFLFPAAAQALTASCVASPASVAVGQAVTWTVSVSGADAGPVWVPTGYLPIKCTRSTCPNMDTPDPVSCSSVGATCTYCPRGEDQFMFVSDYYECQAPGPVTYRYSWSGDDGISGSAQSVSTSYETGGTKRATVIVTDSASNTATASCAVAVTAPPPPQPPSPPPPSPPSPSVSPDLTAGSVTPTSAVPDVAVTLSAPVANRGDGDTGSGFVDLFEINPGAVPATFDSIRTLRTFSSGALDAGAGNTMSVSYAFPSSGTYYVRACADLGTGNSGTIAESNDDNNCGDWIPVSVAVPHPSCVADPSDSSCTGGGPSCGNPGGCGPGAYCSAHSSDPACLFCAAHPGDSSCGPEVHILHLSALMTAASPIAYGDSSTLVYACTDAASAGITSNAGDSWPAVAGDAGGERKVTPSSSTTYTLTCTDSSGNHAWYTVGVIVSAPALSIAASPTLVQSGGASVISWSISGKVDSCTMSGPGLSSRAVSGSSRQVISSESTYTFSCVAGGYHPVKSVTVKVTPSYQEI